MIEEINQRNIVTKEKIKSRSSFLSIFKDWSFKILLAFSILEIVFFPEVTVVLGVVYSLIGWGLIYNFILKKYIIYKHPLSAIIVIGYGLCSFYLPMPATLSEGKPITFNLFVPESVFLQGISSLLVVIFAFLFYKQIYNYIPNSSSLRTILNRTGFYAAPSDFQIWTMGIMGTLSLFFIFYTGANSSEEASTTSKLIQGLFPFAYCPYYIFFKNLYSNAKQKKVNIGIFLAYSCIILLLAFMTNHRATFMKVVMGLCFTYLLGLLLDRFSLKIFTPKKLLIYFVFGYLLTGPLINLGLAMVTARAYKNEVSSMGLVAKTLDIYFDDEAINQTKKKWEGIIVTNKLWDEHYVDNIFLGRLCNLKAADLSLFHSERIKDTSKMRDYMGNLLLVFLPSPLLTIFDIKLDKKQMMKASYGDYLYYLSTGDSYGLESKRQAQINGAGMSTFGYFYLVILFFVMIPVFWLVDLLSFFKDNRVFITIPALTIMPMLMTFFNYEGISTFLAFSIRGWIQLVIVYLILLKLTKIISRFV